VSKDYNPNAVHLTCADVKKAIKYYTEKLGFTLAECWPSPKKPMWANLLLDRQSVMVGGQAQPDMLKEWGASKDEIALCKKDAKRFAKGAHGVGVVIYVMVADVDAHHKAAKKKRANLISAPKTQFYGLREYMVEDLDGYRLSFYTPTAAQDGPQDPAAAASTNA